MILSLDVAYMMTVPLNAKISLPVAFNDHRVPFDKSLKIQRQGYLLTKVGQHCLKEKRKRTNLSSRQIAPCCLLIKTIKNHFFYTYINSFLNIFKDKKTLCIRSRRNEKHYKVRRTKASFKNIFKIHLHKKRHFQNELATKSPQITTQGKGANTFPFHNLHPLLRK